MMLAASKLSTKAFMTLGILLIALHIQGCTEDKYRENPGSSASSSSSGGGLCQPQTPFFGDWKPDFARLDEKAGCNNAWSWLWGNPCASEVPVVFAKKGINEDTDIELILEGVEVETYNCTKSNDGYCAEWTNFEKSCQEEDFGVCTCNEPAPDNKYCQAWTCITKEAEQNICWRGCCGKNCQPCVKCGAPGSAPFPMNRQVFNKLMANDGIFSNVSKDEDENARRLAGVYLDSEIGFLLESLRRAHWGFSYFGPTCIASRDIHSPQGFPCQEWREIETEIQTCRCLLPDSTGNFCMEWKCEEKDVGQFSILFTVEQSYENLIDGQEVEKYTCQEQQPTSLGGSKCIGWRGEIESREEVEVVQCKGCFNLTAPHCQSWNCDEYEVPKIEHYENKWGRRIGFAILHLLWISAIVFVCTLFCAGGCFEVCNESVLGYSFGAIVLACCTAPLIYVIAFARYSDTANYWRIPSAPFLGALLTLGVASLVFICCGFTHPQFEPKDATAFLFSSWFCCIILFGFAWVGGLVAAAPFLLVYLLGCLCFFVGGKERKSAPGMFDDSEAEAFDNW